MNSEESDLSNFLKLRHLIFAEGIEQAAVSPCARQFAAIVLNNSDIVLWKSEESELPAIKWIPWKNESEARIQAIAFNPLNTTSIVESRSELLVISYDGTMYVIPVSKIFFKEPSSYESTQTHSLYPSCPLDGFIPTAIEWWNSAHSRHTDIAVIGGNNGQIVFYSLTQSCYICFLATGSKSPIFSLTTYGIFLDHSHNLLISNDLREQWDLELEKMIDGESTVLLALDENESTCNKNDKNTKVQTPNQHKSVLQEFKQMSLDTFVLLKQKLNDSRKTHTERPRSGSMIIQYSELQSCDRYGEAYMSTQRRNNKPVLTGLFIEESVLAIYNLNDTVPFVYYSLKISSLVTTLLLTDTFIYVADIMKMKHRIIVFSTRLAESKKHEPLEYKPNSFIQSFTFPEEERIINLFTVEKYMNDACLVATNKGLYIISMKNPPSEIALEAVEVDFNIVRKVASVFNLSLQDIIEQITEKMIDKNKVNEALLLCKTTKFYPVKVVLKLATKGYTKDLLEYGEHLLSNTEGDPSLVELIHVSNYVLQCYAELYLRDTSNTDMRKKLMKFLKNNHYYDEEIHIHLLANYKLWMFTHIMAVWRGVTLDGAVALAEVIAQSQSMPFKNLHHFEGFWEFFSEPALIHHLILSPRSVHLHIQFFREHLEDIPESILKKLYDFYDPIQPSLIPVLNHVLEMPKEKYLKQYDIKTGKWGYYPNMFDWISNFLFLHIHMYKHKNYDYALNRYVTSVYDSMDKKFPDECPELLKAVNSPVVLSAGNGHAAMVRNGSLLTWGQSSSGCLGNGPSLSPNCVVAINSWLDDHKIIVKEVSCGKNHTVVITDNGVYSWGSNKYGQLGAGKIGQSLYPVLIESLTSNHIISVDCGQYHSLAIDSSGRLWTWGWGIYGQLGHGSIDNHYYPKIVEALKKKIIMSVSGGQAHSIVLTLKGKVYTFGCNTYGQLGIGTTTKSSLPVKVFTIVDKIVSVSTNYFHNLILSDSNRLYTWGCSPQILKLQAQCLKRARSLQNAYDKSEHGDNFNGNLENLAGSEPKVNEKIIDDGKHLCPTLVDTSLIQDQIMQISCGLFHSALITVNNQIYTWGRNVDGQLGNCKRQTEISIPTSVNLFSMKLLPQNKQQIDLMNGPSWRISCGKDYTLAAEINNRLFGWGNNTCGQLGILPHEDNTREKYVNGKFIVNKNLKRVIKVSHNAVNLIEKPVEIQGLPKVRLMFSDVVDSFYPTGLKLDLKFPEFSKQNYPVTQSKILYSEPKFSPDQVLHYYLECFHGYYHVDFISNACAENNNYQAMSKIYGLNYHFYEAFFYGLKSVFAYVEENYFFKSFKDNHEDLKTRLVPKNITKKYNNEGKEMDDMKNMQTFEFVEDILAEATDVFKRFYKKILKFTPEKIGLYLKKALSVWISWELPLEPLECFFSQNWNEVAYPLAVFLFCDKYKSLIPLNDQELKNSSQIENNWKENTRYESLAQNMKSLSPETVRFKYLNFESSVEFENLCDLKSEKRLESNDSKFELSSLELLQSFSVPFTLKLCNVIIESMIDKPNSEYEEFIRLLHEVVFTPSILKSDNRNPDDVFSSVLNTLQRSQSGRKKFIHISYDELREQPISCKFIVFSCGHYFISQSDFEKEVKTVVRELETLRLVSTSELVNRLYKNMCYTTCCPNCLFQYVESDTC